jgi:hypothetical protein
MPLTVLRPGRSYSSNTTPRARSCATVASMSSTVTLNIYAHVMSGDDERAADTVEEMIKKQLEKKGVKNAK